MSNSKNKAVIGAFVVGAVALAVAGVLVFGGGEFFKKKSMRVMYFEGSVKGLKVGAPVVFRGVEVGTVNHIAISADPTDWTAKIPVIVELDPESWGVPGWEKYDSDKELSRAIERGLRAKLGLQSMVTGMLQIDLDFMPDTKPRLVGGKTPYLEIPTTASGMEKFTQQIKDLPLKEVLGNFSATLLSIKDVVDNPALKESVQHLNETMLAVKKLIQHVDVDVVGPVTQTIQDADQMILDVNGRIKPLLGKADMTLAGIDKLVVDVDTVIKPLVTSIEGAVKSAKATSDTARPAINNLGKAFANIESMTRSDSKERERLDNMIKALSSAARSIRNWADYLERHPEALIRGKGGPKQRR
jgi:paraquat-inducible protein B